MKTALCRHGKPLVAADNSPKEARCPHCGGTVTLRYRKLMANGGTIYFWRHAENQQLCRRPSPMMHVTVRFAT